MRTWGRTYDELGRPAWVEVSTDPQGFNDMVYLTALAQTLKLNLGESPFWGDWGIPAHPSVVQQVFPDFNVWLTQQRYAPRFASLIVAKEPLPEPTYRINITTNQGVTLNASVPVPT